MIFVDPVAGVADEADTPAFQIFKTAEIIADFAGQGLGVNSVYGEIAPGRILPPIVAERDGSAASLRGNIAAPRGNFDGHPPPPPPTRALIDPGSQHPNN